MDKELNEQIRWLKDKDLYLLFYKNYINHPNRYGKKWSFFQCIKKAFEHTSNPINSLFKGWSINNTNESEDFWLNILHNEKYDYGRRNF